MESVYLGARKQEAREGGHMPQAFISGAQPSLCEAEGLSRALKGSNHTVCYPQSLLIAKVT